MKSLRQVLGLLLAAILLFFLIKPFVQTHAQLRAALLQIRWGWLLCSFAGILFYWSAYLYPFAKLLGSLAQRPVSFHTAFTLFHLANITRYLPGRIWGVVRLLSISHRFGLSKSTVGGSLTLHVGIETALGGLLALSLFFSKQMRDTAISTLDRLSSHTLLLILAVIGTLGVVLFCIPKVSTEARQFLKTLRPLLKDSGLWGNVLSSHTLLWCCHGFSFYLFVRSLAPVKWANVCVLAACFAFAWLVGFLSFLTPGGLGVREGLLGLFLSHYMSLPEATLIALLCRVWMLSAELVLAGAAFYLHKRREQQGLPPRFPQIPPGLH